jgi:hypothetical protein
MVVGRTKEPAPTGEGNTDFESVGDPQRTNAADAVTAARTTAGSPDTKTTVSTERERERKREENMRTAA